MTIMWPIHVLTPRDVAFDIAPRSLAGPSSISGFTQVVASDAGLWKAKFSNILVNSRNDVLAWRAIATLLEGRLNPILIPLCRGYQPTPSGFVEEDVPHDDDTPFDDDTEYAADVIDVTLDGAIAVRAVSASIDITYAGTIEPGMHFSLGERLYRIRSVDYTSDTTADITFRPPAREAVADGTQLRFDNPVCRMRLADDSGLDLDLQGRRRATPSVLFIEDV